MDYDADEFADLRPCAPGEPFGDETRSSPTCRPPWQGGGLPWQLAIEFPFLPVYGWGLGARTNRLGSHWGLAADFWPTDAVGFGLEGRLVILGDGWSDADGDGEDDNSANLYTWLAGGGLRLRAWTDAVVREGWTFRIDGLYGWPSGGYGLRPGPVLGTGFERHFGGLEVDGWSWQLGFGLRYLRGFGEMAPWQALLLAGRVQLGWNAREPAGFDGSPPRPKGLPHYVGVGVDGVVAGKAMGGRARLRLGFPFADGWLEGRLDAGMGTAAWRPQADVDEYYVGGSVDTAAGLRLNVPLFFMGLGTHVALYVEALGGVRATYGAFPAGDQLVEPFGTAGAGLSLVFDELRFDLIGGGVRFPLLPGSRAHAVEGYYVAPFATVSFGDFRGSMHRSARRRHIAEMRRERARRPRRRRAARTPSRTTGRTGVATGTRTAAGGSAHASGALDGRGSVRLPSPPRGGVRVGVDVGVGGSAGVHGDTRSPDLPPAGPPTEFHLGVFAHGALQGLAWGVLPWRRIGSGRVLVEIHGPAGVLPALRGLFLAEASRRGVHLAPGRLRLRASAGIQVKVVVRDVR